MKLAERVELLDRAANDPQLQADLLELCRRDIVYWFNTFCWTYDPRTRQGRLPFELYPFQEDVVLQLKEAIDNQHDLLVDKSRDMGVSWLVLLVFHWFWLFIPSNNFLLGSRKEEYVDKLGDISTLFPKIRFNNDNLPVWMLPAGYDVMKHDSFMRLVNPENDNVITGESANQNFGRGGRYSGMLFDEFPFWPTDDAAWASASQSGPCRIAVGTPYGKGNRFARIRFGTDGTRTKILSIHWSLHPKKDAAWYEAQKERLSEDEVARELDISYTKSVQGAVFKKEFNPLSHKVPGAYRFQPMWKTVVSFDFGTTVCCLIAQIDPSDTLHVFKEIILKGNGNTEDIAEAYKDYAATLQLKSRPLFTCDPAGKTREHKTRAMKTDIEMLAAAGISPVLYYKAEAINNRLQEGIKLIRSKLSRRKDGRERILIYEDGCPTLIEAFESEYKYKVTNKLEQLDIIDEKHPWEDVMDCLRYIILEVFTVTDQKQDPNSQPPELYFDV